MQKEKIDYFKALTAIGTVDGRESPYTKPLREFLSEGALHKYRALIMIENMIHLSLAGLPDFPYLSEKEVKKMRKIIATFDATAVAEYDHFGRGSILAVEHDVKAVELYLRERYDKAGLSHLKEFIHFPMTSEDVNNLAWNLMIRGSTNNVWLPKLRSVCDLLSEKTTQGALIPVLGRTHGMSASTTTFGKRYGYFLDKFTTTLTNLTNLELSGKWGGPVGNHNAMTVASPEFDIEAYSRNFVESFGFIYEPIEHQRNSHYEIVRFLNEVNMVNITALDLCKYVRNAVTLGLLDQTAVEGTVGSSVMPHKINPWYFEVAQGYLEQVITFIDAAKLGLIPSTYERDLTDHPWERSYGEMIGKSLIALCYIEDGLQTLVFNEENALAELKATPEILLEAVNIVGRLNKCENIYMKIKDLSRGKKLTLKLIHQIIDESITNKAEATKLKELRPEQYFGKAGEQSLSAVSYYNGVRRLITGGILHPLAGISTVFFDFDQTLHFGDKEELHARLSAIAKKLNLGFSDEAIKQFGNRSDFQEMKKLMVETYNQTAEIKITEADFQTANDEVTGSFDHHFYVAEDTKELLVFLRSKGYRTGLVSTRGRQSLDRLLKLYGIEDLFDVIVSRGDAKERKPHPEPLVVALEKLELTGSEVLFVGDKQIDDIQAAKARNMMSVLICAEECQTRGAVPDFHFRSLRELFDLFKLVA